MSSSGRPSKRQTGKTHHDGVGGQSGHSSYGQPRKPQRSGGRSGQGGPSIGEILFGPSKPLFGHGGSKKNGSKGRKKR